MQEMTAWRRIAAGQSNSGRMPVSDPKKAFEKFVEFQASQVARVIHG